MDLDDKPRPPKPEDLTLLSIEELEARIAHMESEIARMRTLIGAKQAQRASADSIFRKS